MDQRKYKIIRAKQRIVTVLPDARSFPVKHVTNAQNQEAYKSDFPFWISSFNSPSFKLI